jgi:hypothetical protein
MSQSTAPSWLKPLIWIALIWNLFGVIAFVMQMLITPETISKLPLDQQAAYTNVPIWSVIAFAVAVFGGVLGCLFLLNKNALAIPTFSLSLGAILLQQYYNYIVLNSVEVLGVSAILMPILVIAIALLLLYVSIKGKQQGWLN